MDLKQVQNELKESILLHQTVFGQFKKDPKNITLKQKLSSIQQTIGNLGRKQKEIQKKLTNLSGPVKSLAKQHGKPQPLNLTAKGSKSSSISDQSTITKSDPVTFEKSSQKQPLSLGLKQNGESVKPKINDDENALFRLLQQTDGKTSEKRRKTRLPIILQKPSSSSSLFNSSSPSTSKSFLGIRSKSSEDGIQSNSAFTKSRAFQNFRIQDGKTVRTMISGEMDAKPRNDALKEVLAQAKAIIPKQSQISLNQQVPRKHCVEGFVPITHMGNSNHSISPKSVPYNHRHTRPTSAPLRKTTPPILLDNSDLHKMEKFEYLRNLNLVPMEVAKSMANRRFSKRKIAANPVYSGGIYVAHNELKRTPSPYLETPDSEIMAPPKHKKIRPKTRRSESEMEVQRLAQNYDELKRLMREAEEMSSSDKNGSLVIDDEKTKNKRKRKDKNKQEIDSHEDQCTVCHEAGEVLMCDTCSLVYHLQCCTPPLKEVPTGMWVCSNCKCQFQSTSCGLAWTNVTDIVHAYHIHHTNLIEQRKKLMVEVAKQRGMKLFLEKEAENLTHKIKESVCVRSKAMREGKSTKERLKEMSAIVLYLNKKTQVQDQTDDNVALS